MTQSLSTACVMLLFTAAAAVIAGCGEDPIGNLVRNCTAPAGITPFAFESGTRELSGFIDAPASPGPHPAIVLIHGEGPTDITRGVGDFPQLREAFRRAGIASVVWDKAGSGCSSGRYRGLADLYLRTDEVLAAVAALKESETIDPERIGLWAIGQGGWVAPMAAVGSEDIALLIVVGGPAGDPVSQRLYLFRRNVELEGYSEDEAERLTAALADALEMMRNQVPYEDYVAAMEPLARHPFVERLMDLASDLFPTARRYDELRGSGALDVTADVFLPAVDVPVLALWGNLDSQFDPEDGARAYREAAERGANDDVAIEIFAGANHRICEARTGSLDESRSSSCELVDGYVPTMIAWLRAHDFVSPIEPTQSAANGSGDRQRDRGTSAEPPGRR